MTPHRGPARRCGRPRRPGSALLRTGLTLLLGAGLLFPPARGDTGLTTTRSTPFEPCESLADLIDRVAPSVVAVQAAPGPRPTRAEPASNGPPSDPLGLGRFQLGSGLIVDPAGLILTCEHVIRGADAVHVVLADGRRLRAETLAIDAYMDFAVLRIAARDLAAAELGGADAVRRGERVLAAGFPLGVEPDGAATFSDGMISGLERTPTSLDPPARWPDASLLQTTARINPGHSGGPLFGLDGRVIGVVSAIASRSGVDEGVAFAIPMNDRSRQIIAALSRGESVEHGHVGIAVRRRTPLAEASGQPGGVVVARVDSQSPGGAAGLRVDDVITAMDGLAVAGPARLLLAIDAAPVGRALRLAIARGNQRFDATVLVGRAPPVGPAAAVERREWRGALLGLLLVEAPPKPGLAGGALLVLRVNTDSPCAAAGLEPGDIIVRVAGRELTDDHAADRGLRQTTGDVLVGLASGRTLIVPER